MRILVFGNSGSGKSTLARSLVHQRCLAHLDLDSIVWEPGQIAVQRQPDDVRASLNDFISREPSWVIEGCYGELVQFTLKHCTKLVFLNPGLSACLRHSTSRPWEPHKYQSPEHQEAMLENLQSWIKGYYERTDAWSYRYHRQLFDAFQGPKVELVSSGVSAAAVLQDQQICADSG